MYGSKFNSITVIKGMERDIYTPATDLTRYVYFLGSGEICMDPDGCNAQGQYKPTGLLYLARVPATEYDIGCPQRYRFYTGLDNGLSQWSDDISQARPLYDLSSSGLYPVSVVRHKGLYWLTVASNVPPSEEVVAFYNDNPLLKLTEEDFLNEYYRDNYAFPERFAGTLVFTSPDGIHWRFTDRIKYYDGITIDGLNLMRQDHPEWPEPLKKASPVKIFYGPIWMPPSATHDTQGTGSTLSYVFSIWNSYQGFLDSMPQNYPSMPLQGNDPYPYMDYNVKLAKWTFPVQEAHLVHNDGYLTERSIIIDRQWETKPTSRVLALPFKGFRPDYKENKVLIQYCDCGDEVTDENICKETTCKPHLSFIMGPQNPWITIQIEPEAAWVGRSEPQRFPCPDQELGSGIDYLCGIPFKTTIDPLSGGIIDGSPSMPIWQWYDQFKIRNNGVARETASVILRFSYWEGENLTPDKISEELLDNIRLSPVTDPTVVDTYPDHYRTTDVLRLERRTAAALPYRPLEIDYDLLFMIWERLGGPQPWLVKYDPFTRQSVKVAGTEYANDDVPPLPDGFSIAAGRAEETGYTYFAWGGTAESGALPNTLYKGVYHTSEKALVWSATSWPIGSKRSFNANEREELQGLLDSSPVKSGADSSSFQPSLVEGAVMIYDSKYELLHLVGAPDEEGSGGRVFLLGIKSLSFPIAETGWVYFMDFPSISLHAGVTPKNSHQYFIVGGASGTPGSNSVTYNREVYLYDVEMPWDLNHVTDLPNGGLEGASVRYDSLTDTLYVFGGIGAGGVNNELLQYSVATKVWTTLSSGSGSGSGFPPAKHGGVIAYDRYLKAIHLIGGVTEDGTPDDNQWSYSLAGNTWNMKSPEPQCGNPSVGECAAGQYCGDDLKCHTGCGSDADCTVDQFCENHQCMMYCSEDDDCPDGYVCREFIGGHAGMRCARLKDPDCQGCTCDYFDEGGIIIDGCSGEPQAGCTSVKARPTASRSESLLALLLLCAPVVWWRVLRRRSGS